MLADTAVVSLDLDDTLWDVGHVIRRAERQVGQWLRDEAPSLADYLASSDLAQLRRDVIARHPEQHHDYSFLRRAIYRDAASAVGLQGDIADAAFAEFHRWRNTVDLFSDVEPALAALAAQYPLIAVTNGTADLALVGLDQYFIDSVSAIRAGVAKPHPHIFALAAQLAGHPTERVVHVGDDPHLDVDGAREAGMQTVWLNRPGMDWPAELAPPDLAVRDLGQLAEALRGRR